VIPFGLKPDHEKKKGLLIYVVLKYSQLILFWTPAFAGVTAVSLKCHSRENGNPEQPREPVPKSNIKLRII
jgi:hypothetical protein